MLLDLYEKHNQAALEYGARHPARDLTAEFEESYEIARDHGNLFGASIARANARWQAAQDHVDEIFRKTGTRLPLPIDLAEPSLVDAPIDQGPVRTPLDAYNEKVTGLSAQFPELGLKPLTSADLDQMGRKRAGEARERYERLGQRDQTWGGLAGSLVGAGEAALKDPVNQLTLPLGAATGTGILATALIEAGIAGFSQAVIETAAAPFQEEVKPGFAESGEKAANILEAGAFGGVLGGGVKGLAAVWRRARTGQWGREVKDAGNVVDSEANIAETNVFPGAEGEVAHRTALQQSLDDMLGIRPVSGRVEDPFLLQGYEQRLAPVLEARANAATAGERAMAIELEAARLPATMERLSEMQLAQFREDARRIAAETAQQQARVEREEIAIAGERAAIAERRNVLEPRRGDLEGLRGELTALQERADAIAPKADPVTEARLAAVEAELSQPAIGRDRRALLEAERKGIRATLEGEPALKRERGSLAQEIKGRGKEIARIEREIAKAEAQAAKADTGLAARETKARVTRELTGERAVSRTEALQTELRKSIETLARDGYNIRIGREEADAMAERILQADDGIVDDVLRSVTDTMVHRAQEAPGRPRTIAGARQERRTEYWSNELRKRIQGLAREVGYEMPPDEAATIAMRLRTVPEQEALHLLDEVLLRPRTLTELLPGMKGSIEVPNVVKPPKPFETRIEVAGVRRPDLEAKIAAIQTPDIEKAMVDPKTRDAIIVDLDRLRAERGGLMVPTEGPDGALVMRNVEELVDELDAELAAAKDLRACASPQTEAAE